MRVFEEENYLKNIFCILNACSPTKHVIEFLFGVKSLRTTSSFGMSLGYQKMISC